MREHHTNGVRLPFGLLSSAEPTLDGKMLLDARKRHTGVEDCRRWHTLRSYLPCVLLLRSRGRSWTETLPRREG